MVLAQAASELRARDAIEGALRIAMHREGDNGYRRWAEVIARQCRPSLRDKRTQENLEVITRRSPVAEPWWPKYSAHVHRRNGIVHDGLVVTKAQATASSEAVDACMDWLRRLWAGEPWKSRLASCRPLNRISFGQ
ncbi:MAG TPA: hypothetical protein VFR97_13185 [Capillimicrobium sp.]|nr:hypothetical protein [Capillimicrobium sp.]